MTDDGGMTERAHRIAQIAEELRAQAANGLYFSRDPYDRDHYERVRDLAAELFALVDGRPVGEIAAAYRGDLTARSPHVGVDAAIFDGDGRLLLVQRSDVPEWCMPGGMAEVGESPSAAAVRETYEETGLRVRARRLIGVYDNRRFPGHPVWHSYHLVFDCEAIGGTLSTTVETISYGWFAEAEAVALPLFRGHVHKVPDAFGAHRNFIAGARFH